MSVSGASDGSGSGLAKYLFFVDNNSNNATQVNADSTGKKTYSYTTTTGYHTCHVSAVDKAGNVSSTKSFAEGRTKQYQYGMYRIEKSEKMMRNDNLVTIGAEDRFWLDDDKIWVASFPPTPVLRNGMPTLEFCYDTRPCVLRKGMAIYAMKGSTHWMNGSWVTNNIYANYQTTAYANVAEIYVLCFINRSCLGIFELQGAYEAVWSYNEEYSSTVVTNSFEWGNGMCLDNGYSVKYNGLI